MYSLITDFVVSVTHTVETMYRKIYDLVALDDDNMILSTSESMFLNKNRLTKYNLRTSETWDTICWEAIPLGMALVKVGGIPFIALSYQ